MSKISSKIKAMKGFAVILLGVTSTILFVIGEIETLLLGIMIPIIIIGIIGIFIEKTIPIMIGAMGLIVVLVMVSILYSYSTSSIIENNNLLSELTPKDDHFGNEEYSSFKGILYIVFSILLLCYLEVGYSIIRYSKFAKLMKNYNENGQKYGYEKTNFFTSNLKTTVNQYFIFIGILSAFLLILLIFSLNTNKFIAEFINEQLSKSIEFHAIYGQVLSIFALFAVIGICRMLIPENRKTRKNKKLKKLKKKGKNKNKDARKNTLNKDLKEDSDKEFNNDSYKELNEVSKKDFVSDSKKKKKEKKKFKKESK